mmetsp:Transcript_77760/g.116956  ORF Transcript_77760/g.116956 Transcript_77760/m.116956 type:complete len:162 (-) Transcript_77760:1331-1816(-)
MSALPMITNVLCFPLIAYLTRVDGRGTRGYSFDGSGYRFGRVKFVVRAGRTNSCRRSSRRERRRWLLRPVVTKEMTNLLSCGIVLDFYPKVIFPFEEAPVRFVNYANNTFRDFRLLELIRVFVLMLIHIDQMGGSQVAGVFTSVFTPSEQHVETAWYSDVI